MQDICFICIKKLYNIETTIKPQKEKINIEVINEKLQKLEININYMELRIWLLEEEQGIIRERNNSTNINKVKEILEEACKAASIRNDLQDETIIPIAK